MSKCEIMTESSKYGTGVALHIAGLELSLTLEDALRISQGLFQAVEEQMTADDMAALALRIQAAEDFKPFTLSRPSPLKEAP